MHRQVNHAKPVKKRKMCPLQDSHFQISNIYIYVEITSLLEIYHQGRKQCAELGPLVNHWVLAQVVYRTVLGVSGRKPTIAHAPITHDLLFARGEIDTREVFCLNLPTCSLQQECWDIVTIWRETIINHVVNNPITLMATWDSTGY